MTNITATFCKSNSSSFVNWNPCYRSAIIAPDDYPVAIPCSNRSSDRSTYNFIAHFPKFIAPANNCAHKESYSTTDPSSYSNAIACNTAQSNCKIPSATPTDVPTKAPSNRL
jgi:hypothetical protein